MNHYRYEDLQVGQEENFSVQISAEMLNDFKKITNDINPLHNDEEFAKVHHYDGRVAYGMLTSSFLSTLAGVYLPGEFCLIQSVEVKFVKPVYIGDTLQVSGIVDELHDTVKQIVLKVCISNQNGIKVLRGKMKLGVLE